MLKYIVKRILQMIPMMIILSIVVFCMVRLIPGDPVTMSLGMGAGKEAIAAETARLGLDKPLWQQYFIWVKNLFHGDFGTSISTHKAVLYEIGRRYPNTIKLAIGATIVSTVLGVSFGILAAVKHSKFTDNLLMVVSLISISTPSFFLAMILMLIFCIWLHLLPVSGFDTWQKMLLPILTLGTQEVGYITRITRSSMVPSPKEYPKGCRFCPRCPYAAKLCQDKQPPLTVLPDGRKVRCWKYDEQEGKNFE